jgi:hypothetical protein
LSAAATLRFTGVEWFEPLLHQINVKKWAMAWKRRMLADISPFDKGQCSCPMRVGWSEKGRARPLNDLSISGLRSGRSFGIIDVFVILFRRTAADETILPPDETISRFGADVRKQRMDIYPANKNGGQRRYFKPERVKCEI